MIYEYQTNSKGVASKESLKRVVLLELELSKVTPDLLDTLTDLLYEFYWITYVKAAVLEPKD